jgi:1-acyl-sn-glycerol-3-phosphate acyltransferase
LGWALVGSRGALALLPLALGVAVMALARLVERPLCHPRRPATPWISVVACRLSLLFLGIGWRREGRPVAAGVIAANHVGWLDILALNAAGPVVFVAKADVADMPGVGLLAWITGTAYVRREARSETGAQVQALAARLRAGERLVLFPEGTTSDGRRVLPFRSALFAALGAPGLPEGLALQPATLVWEAPPGEDPRFYGWWGDVGLGSHILSVLSVPRQGRVTLRLHEPIPVGPGIDRKALARAAEAAVRAGLG